MIKAVNSKLKIQNLKLPLILFLLPFFLSCTLGPGNFQSKHSTDLSTRILRRIAVLPPGQTAVEDKSGKREPITILNDLLYATVSALPNWQIVSDREVREVLAMVPQGGSGSRAKKLGELVYADAVLSGRIIRFRERVGEDWGVQSPASVAFVLDLWDVKRGDLIWSGQFDETQKPLIQNLFSISEFTQRGARWLTAEELTHEGVKKAVNQLHQILYPNAS